MLQFILQQNQKCLLHQMLLAQKEHPIRGDWVSEVSKSIEDLGIDLKFEEIREI